MKKKEKVVNDPTVLSFFKSTKPAPAETPQECNEPAPIVVGVIKPAPVDNIESEIIYEQVKAPSPVDLTKTDSPTCVDIAVKKPVFSIFGPKPKIKKTIEVPSESSSSESPNGVSDTLIHNSSPPVEVIQSNQTEEMDVEEVVPVSPVEVEGVSNLRRSSRHRSRTQLFVSYTEAPTIDDDNSNHARRQRKHHDSDLDEESSPAKAKKSSDKGGSSGKLKRKADIFMSKEEKRQRRLEEEETRLRIEREERERRIQEQMARTKRETDSMLCRPDRTAAVSEGTNADTILDLTADKADNQKASFFVARQQVSSLTNKPSSSLQSDDLLVSDRDYRTEDTWLSAGKMTADKITVWTKKYDTGSLSFPVRSLVAQQQQQQEVIDVLEEEDGPPQWLSAMSADRVSMMCDTDSISLRSLWITQHHHILSLGQQAEVVEVDSIIGQSRLKQDEDGQKLLSWMLSYSSSPSAAAAAAAAAAANRQRQAEEDSDDDLLHNSDCDSELDHDNDSDDDRPRKHASRQDDNNNHIFLIEGPTGCGKTDMIHTAAKTAGLHTIELNCGTSRSPATLKRLLQETAGCSSKSKATVLLLDEIDVLLDDDEVSLLTTLPRLLSRSKGCPIVVTANIMPASLKALTGGHKVSIKRMESALCAEYLSSFLVVEESRGGGEGGGGVLQKLGVYSRGDLRAMITTLQLLARSSPSVRSQAKIEKSRELKSDFMLFDHLVANFASAFSSSVRSADSADSSPLQVVKAKATVAVGVPVIMDITPRLIPANSTDYCTATISGYNLLPTATTTASAAMTSMTVSISGVTCTLLTADSPDSLTIALPSYLTAGTHTVTVTVTIDTTTSSMSASSVMGGSCQAWILAIDYSHPMSTVDMSFAKILANMIRSYQTIRGEKTGEDFFSIAGGNKGKKGGKKNKKMPRRAVLALSYADNYGEMVVEEEEPQQQQQQQQQEEQLTAQEQADEGSDDDGEGEAEAADTADSNTQDEAAPAATTTANADEGPMKVSTTEMDIAADSLLPLINIIPPSPSHALPLSLSTDSILLLPLADIQHCCCHDAGDSGSKTLALPLPRVSKVEAQESNNHWEALQNMSDLDMLLYKDKTCEDDGGSSEVEIVEGRSDYQYCCYLQLLQGISPTAADTTPESTAEQEIDAYTEAIEKTKTAFVSTAELLRSPYLAHKLISEQRLQSMSNCSSFSSLSRSTRSEAILSLPLILRLAEQAAKREAIQEREAAAIQRASRLKKRSRRLQRNITAEPAVNVAAVAVDKYKYLRAILGGGEESVEEDVKRNIDEMKKWSDLHQAWWTTATPTTATASDDHGEEQREGGAADMMADLVDSEGDEVEDNGEEEEEEWEG